MNFLSLYVFCFILKYMALYSLLCVQCYFFMGFSENVESLSGFSKKLLVLKVLQILSKAETEKIKSKISEVLQLSIDIFPKIGQTCSINSWHINEHLCWTSILTDGAETYKLELVIYWLSKK